MHRPELAEQHFAAPVPIRPRAELAAENDLLRQIVDLQARVLSLTEQLKHLDHAWEPGYRLCTGCHCWLPLRAYMHNGGTRIRSRCQECDVSRRKALRETAG